MSVSEMTERFDVCLTPPINLSCRGRSGRPVDVLGVALSVSEMTGEADVQWTSWRGLTYA